MEKIVPTTIGPGYILFDKNTVGYLIVHWNRPICDQAISHIHC